MRNDFVVWSFDDDSGLALFIGRHDGRARAEDIALFDLLYTNSIKPRRVVIQKISEEEPA